MRNQRSRVMLLMAGGAIAAAVAGCSATGGERPRSASPLPPSSSASSASPEPSTEAGATIPVDCRDAVDTETYAATFTDIPLNDPTTQVPSTGVVEPQDPDPSAGMQGQLLAATTLWCVWRDPRADITGLSARFGRVDAAAAESFLLTLPDDGYSCSEEYDGLLCQRTRQNDQYPVEEGATQFLRDDIYINVVQANFPTDGLIGAFVETIWG